MSRSTPARGKPSPRRRSDQDARPIDRDRTERPASAVAPAARAARSETVAQGLPGGAEGPPTAAQEQRDNARDLQHVPTASREVVRRRQAILNRWDMACREAFWLGVGRDAATRRMLQEDGKVSRATLYRWARRYRHQGLVGLVDRRLHRDRTDRPAAVAKGLTAGVFECLPAGCTEAEQRQAITWAAFNLRGEALRHLASYGLFLQRTMNQKPLAGGRATAARPPRDGVSKRHRTDVEATNRTPRKAGLVAN